MQQLILNNKDLCTDFRIVFLQCVFAPSMSLDAASSTKEYRPTGHGHAWCDQSAGPNGVHTDA